MVEKMTDREGVAEDEDGLPVGYADWYSRYRAGLAVNTEVDHACEAAWRAAIATQKKEGV